MEALLRCQVSQTVPRDQPQERCTTLPFKLLTPTHIADINGLSAKKHVQKQASCCDFDMNGQTVWGAFLFPRLNFLINCQAGEMF